MHPTLFYFLKVLGVHHSELKYHLYLLEELHAMVSWLHVNTSNFGGDNRFSIINLREVVQEFHKHLAMVDSGSEIFTCQHNNVAVVYLRLQFKERMASVSTAVHTQMDS